MPELFRKALKDKGEFTIEMIDFFKILTLILILVLHLRSYLKFEF